jgi:hypothetical protein
MPLDQECYQEAADVTILLQRSKGCQNDGRANALKLVLAREFAMKLPPR